MRLTPPSHKNVDTAVARVRTPSLLLRALTTSSTKKKDGYKTACPINEKQSSPQQKRTKNNCTHKTSASSMCLPETLATKYLPRQATPPLSISSAKSRTDYYTTSWIPNFQENSPNILRQQTPNISLRRATSKHRLNPTPYQPHTNIQTNPTQDK